MPDSTMDFGGRRVYTGVYRFTKQSGLFETGAFHLEQDHKWGFCWIMPGEFWVEDGRFFVEASGFQPFEQQVYTRHGSPFTFRGPIELYPNTK